jgi:HEAT repeat protein
LDIEAAQYRDQLVGASPKKRDSALTTLKDGEGVVYTLALADAIPKLPKEFQDKARQALAERLSRMTPQTLRDKFNDVDVEIRKAAIAAAVLKEDKSLVSDLSELLEDPSSTIAGLADEAIKALSKSKEKQKAAQTAEVSASKNQSQGGDKDLKSLPQGN